VEGGRGQSAAALRPVRLGRRGATPSPSFDTQYYLVHAPDVAAAGIDPLVDYLRSGIALGRPTLPAVGPANQITANRFRSGILLDVKPRRRRCGCRSLSALSDLRLEGGAGIPTGCSIRTIIWRTTPMLPAAGVDPLLHYDPIRLAGGPRPPRPCSARSTICRPILMYSLPTLTRSNTSSISGFMRGGSCDRRLARVFGEDHLEPRRRPRISAAVEAAGAPRRGRRPRDLLAAYTAGRVAKPGFRLRQLKSPASASGVRAG